MKTIYHVTTINTIKGVKLAESVKHSTKLDVPEFRDDVVNLMQTDEGLKNVCKWITDSLKLERNGEVRAELFPSNPAEIVRQKVKSHWSETDLKGFMDCMKQPTKAANKLLDEYYQTADADVKAEIDAIEE